MSGDVRLNPIQKKVLLALYDPNGSHPALRKAEIIKTTGLSREEVESAICFLQFNGFIEPKCEKNSHAR